jgi:hypothetical protein
MKFILIAAATLVAGFHITSAQAQAVIDNPELCEQFYPNANCTDMGPGNPYTGGGNRDPFPEPQWHRDRVSHNGLREAQRPTRDTGAFSGLLGGAAGDKD